MDLKGARVGVFGGAGFVGSHLVDLLTQEDVSDILVFDNFVRGTRANLSDAARDPRVEIIEGDIVDREHVQRVMEGVDVVFLLAALWLGQCVDDPRACVNVNIVGNFNVIEAAHQAGVKRIVYSSSASVYGDALTKPMTEDHPFNNRTMYGAGKIAVEQILRAYNDMYGLDYVGYRYMNIYGPRMDYKGTYVSVIMKVLDRIHAGQPPIIFGDGSQTYDFIYVTDIARANILGAKSDVTDEFFNIGTGVETSINELVHLLLDLTGSELRPTYRPQAHMFVSHRVGSTEKAEELLGFQAEVGLREGLQTLLRWRETEWEKEQT
ncbi:MAG: NAD-dependent epimerase/dehydratase family protein [Anaerolineae bacterium]